MGAACAARLVDIVDVVLLVDRDEHARGTDRAPARTQPRRTLRRRHHRCRRTGTPGRPRRPTSARCARYHTRRASRRRWPTGTTCLQVDLVGSALLVEALLPLVTAGTAMVFFASIAPLIPLGDVDAAAAAALDDPLNPQLFDRLHDTLGPTIEDSGLAYMWAKRGVLRLVRREAIRMGRKGGRICSVSPGIIDTPMGRQEDAARAIPTHSSCNTRRWVAKVGPRK